MLSCPLLPAHLAAAAADAATLFTTRTAEKDAKHLAGCVDLGRTFMAVVFTTIGGIGPPEATDWIVGLFAASYVSERLAGGTGYQTSMQKSRLYQSLHACCTRGSCGMVEHLALPPAAAAHAL